MLLTATSEEFTQHEMKIIQQKYKLPSLQETAHGDHFVQGFAFWAPGEMGWGLGRRNHSP